MIRFGRGIPMFLAWALTFGVFAMPALSQTMEQRGYRPVDQRFEDVDPMQRSLRQREGGLRMTGERQNIFRARLPDRSTAGERRKSRLFYVAEGVVAEFDRSIYGLDRRSRRIFHVIPPNTVFHVGLPDAADEPAPPTDAQRRRREALRVDRRAAVSRPLDRRVQPAPAPSGRTNAADSADYATVAEGHRRRVAMVIRQLGRQRESP